MQLFSHTYLLFCISDNQKSNKKKSWREALKKLKNTRYKARMNDEKKRLKILEHARKSLKDEEDKTINQIVWG